MNEQADHHPHLAHSQVQIWIGQRLHPHSPLYNMAFAWRIGADLDVDLFQQAWKRVADASDALRTSVVEHAGGARLQIMQPGACETQLLDFRGHPDPEAFSDWCRERCTRPLPFEGPLVDSVLVKLSNGCTGWFLNQHHVITDAWSTVLLYGQVAKEYARLVGAGPEHAPATLADFYPTAAALAERTTGKVGAQAHWAARLGRTDRCVPLYGRPGKPIGTGSTRLTLTLDAARTRALDRLCSEPGFEALSHDMSRFALFATLLLGWLNRISGRSELGFDAPVSGRPTAESKRALGLFIEMFPFTVTVDTEDSFRSLGAKCLEEAALFLCNALPGTSAPSGAEASNIVLNYFPQAFGDFADAPAEVEWVHPGHGDSVHALRLQVHDFQGSGGLTLHFDFNDRVLPERIRRRALTHFDMLVSALLDDPDRPIASVDLLTTEERTRLRALNATAALPLPDRSVVALFRAQAQAEPERVALRQGGAKVSFASLLEQTEALAATLIEHGVEPGDRVALFATRSSLLVVAVLATLRVRAAYVPIDPAYPASRIAAIVEDSAATLLLAGDVEALAKVLTDRTLDAPVLAIVDGIETGRGHPIDRDDPALDDLAYLLYTSGSTGRPKGVLIEHGGLADYLEWAARCYVRGDHLTFPLFTSLSFDLTVTSLFLPLITGGTLAIYPEPQGPVDSALMAVAASNSVDFIKLTPSHLTLLRQLGLEGSRISRMVVGGEDFKSSLAADISAQLQGCVEIYNEYGPTEAVVACALHRYDPSADTGVSVPIGRPADHVEVEVLNDALVPVPEGAPGELWVSRYGLARGYNGLDELTAERFQPHPDAPGKRRYRTGDRVRLNEAGELDYLGRVDRQIKISGYRIEPGEIEATMLTLPGIEQCVVLAQGQGSATGTDSGNSVRYCSRCGLPSNYPGATFDQQDVCNLCRSYEQIKDHAQAYFRTPNDLRELFAVSARTHTGEYDCMMLLSGGKDSSYALCQLVEMGLSVFAFTLDNGFISESAKENIRRVTGELGVTVEFGSTPAMKAIFRDGLKSFSNVCQGCFKTLYTLSTNRALELDIPIIVTGLSRGQMFETRLTEEMFRDGRCSPDEVDAAVLAARKVYHRIDDEVFRSLDVQVLQHDRVFEQVRFVDFYRYRDVGLDEVLAYLRDKVAWVRPSDTGRSTNCLINDVGIYVHKQERGFHNYALPYSWDVRLGHKNREAALDELNDAIEVDQVSDMLDEVAYEVRPSTTADPEQLTLTAYYIGSPELPPDAIQRHLAERLPAHLIPARLQRVDAIPLNAHGKVDEGALASLQPAPCDEGAASPPDGPVEEYLVELWRQVLGVGWVGVEDDFFALGGTSLAAMSVMIELCNEFAIDLPLQTLFENPTLSTLARVAEERILDDVYPEDETVVAAVPPGGEPLKH